MRMAYNREKQESESCHPLNIPLLYGSKDMPSYQHRPITFVRQPTTEMLAYLAGVMDSDGCFSLYNYPRRTRGQYSIEVFVGIKQTQPEAIQLLAYTFGGTVYLHKPNAKRGKPLYYWKRGSRHAAFVAATLLPYLRIKPRQAEILIEMQAEITSNWGQYQAQVWADYPAGRRLVYRASISPESLARRMTLLQELRGLNHLGREVASELFSTHHA